MATLDTLQDAVNSLTASTTTLVNEVQVKKATLDASVADAQAAQSAASSSATTASGHATSAAASAAAAAATASGIAGFDLDAIAATKAVTAVDVFVYDTSKDSDGGAWRKRCQHTSWYNETLNTATRGARREFPAVAVIVAESNKVTIYDGDDPALPMWMVFTETAQQLRSFLPNFAAMTSVAALNGVLCIGTLTSTIGGISGVEFVKDTLWQYDNLAERGGYGGFNVAQRTEADLLLPTTTTIVNRIVNDVAMTVLPDAPIDPATGLPVPTIAVATDGGVSVIKDDGTVVDIASGALNKAVSFTEDRLLAAYTSFGFRVDDIPTADTTDATWGNNGRYGRNISSDDLILVSANTTAAMSVNNNLYHCGVAGLSSIYENQPAADKGMVAYTTSTYTTGWMPGDIKGAFLADTDETDLVEFSVTESFDYATQQDAETAGLIFSGSGFSFSSGSITFSAVGDTVKIPVSGLVSGGRYKVSFEVLSGSASIRVQAGPNTGPGFASWLNPISLVGYFTATQTTGSFGVQLSGGGPIEIGGVYLELVDYDRSVSANGLIVNGTVTRSPVATGAELVAYSGFSASNYLEQPYNADLDFGTGDFCVMGWVNTTSTASQQNIFFRGDEAASGSYFNLQTLSGYPRIVTVVGGTVATGAVATINNGNWYFVCGTRRNGTLEMFVNGSLAASISEGSRDLTNTSAIARAGRSVFGSVNQWGGSLALLRISATAPTADQIRRIYEDEKVLFQENAACTLYGASDAVTALAHDSDTGLLHVGTSAGRSVFQGLRRVSNTTTAVGTAISASNGLVVEE